MKKNFWMWLVGLAIYSMCIIACSDDEVNDQQDDNQSPEELENAFAVEEEVNKIGSAVFVKEDEDSYELYLLPPAYTYTEESFEPTDALYYVYFSFSPNESGELVGDFSGSTEFEPGTFYMAAVRYDCDQNPDPDNCPDDGYETYLNPEGELSISSSGNNYLITFEFTSYEGAGVQGKVIKGHYEGAAQIFEDDDDGEDDNGEGGGGDNDDSEDGDDNGNGGDDDVDPAPSELANLISGTDSKTWHLEKYGISGFKIDVELCAADDDWIFYADGTFEVNNNESKCDPEDPDQQTGTWSISEDDTTITLSSGETSEEFTFHEVSESEIVLIYSGEEGEVKLYYRADQD